MRRRRYVLELELLTDDKVLAARLRSKALTFAGSLDPDAGIRVTRREVDGPLTSEPVLLMERVLES